MKKRMTAVVCLILVLSMVLGGCDMDFVSDYLERLNSAVNTISGDIGYKDMEYTRPDMTALEQTLAESCEIGRTGTSVNKVLDAIYAYYDCYDEFYTNMLLAYVHYNTDLRDTYWEGEYDYCAQHAGTVDAGLEELYFALAQSPIRDTLDTEDYFGPEFLSAYEGESLWDENFLALLEEETRLEGQYYEVMGEQTLEDYEAFYDAQYDALAQLLVELVKVRQKMAAHMGYGAFSGYAYEYIHQRDFVPAQAKGLMESIRQELVPLYVRINTSGLRQDYEVSCSRQEMTGYVAECAEAMGGYVEESWNLMEGNGLWEIDPGEYKLNASFEVFLPAYRVPLVFVNPTQTQYDKLVLAHEFGHFAHDYVRSGSVTSTDVAEVLSQGMEYLSLCLCEDTQELTRMKMADSLAVYVEQAAYAYFEHQIYELPEEELTAENIRNLYARVGEDFGFDSLEWDTREYVALNHIYTEPMYLISYVVSNDAAFQLYELEQADAGAGGEKYRGMLFSEETQFCAFVENMDLESPFGKNRIPRVKEIMEKILVP